MMEIRQRLAMTAIKDSESHFDGNDNGAGSSMDYDHEKYYEYGGYRQGLRRGDGRSIHEPSIFDHERFERECKPSVKMLKISPSIPAKATAYRDVHTDFFCLRCSKSGPSMTNEGSLYRPAVPVLGP